MADGDDIRKRASDTGHPSRLASLRLNADQLFMQTTAQTRMAQCISDPHQPDCQCLLQRSFRRTDRLPDRRDHQAQLSLSSRRDALPSAVARLREAVEKQVYTVVDVLNYRKDGRRSGTRSISARSTTTKAS